MALKGNQKKLDKNNNNRIDAQDFKILKAEKAKGRGMGLQDEKVKPGKVMKARKGLSFDEKLKRQNKGLTSKTTGKPTSLKALREMKGFKPGETPSQFNQRMDLRKAATKAAKSTRLGKLILPVAAAGVAAQQYLKSKMKKKDEPKKKMGGGMMMKPMGYKSGTSVKAKCKLGRNKPTKMY